MRATPEVSPIARDQVARQILRQISDGVLIVDEDSTIVEASRVACKLLAGRTTSLVGRRLPEVLDGSDTEPLWELIHSVDSALNESTQTEIVLHQPDGKRLYTEFSASRLNVESRSFCLLIIRDVTREEGARRLQRAQEIVAESQLLAGIVSVQFFPETNRLVYSDTFVRLLELAPDRLVTPEDLFEKVHPDDREMIAERWNRLVRDGDGFDCRVRFELSNGTVRHFECNAQVTEVSPDGSPHAVVAVLRDETDELEARRLAQRHRDNVRKLDEIVEALEGFAWEFDLESAAFTFVSPRVVELLGYPVSDWIGDPEFFPGILHPEDRDWVLQYCEEQTQMGADHSMTYRMIAADGEARWFRDIIYLKCGSYGAATHLRGLMIDITDSARLREELRQSEERFQKIFNESPIGLLELDWSPIRKRLEEILASGVTDLRAWMDQNPDEVIELARKGKILAANRAALAMYEARGLDEVVGETSALFRQDSLEVFKQHLLQRLDGVRTFSCENVNYTLTGKRLNVSVSSTPASGAEESWHLLHTSISDITQRKQAELLRDGQQRVLRHLATEPDVHRVLCTLTAEIEQQSPCLRAAVFGVVPAANSLRAISAAGTAQELVTLIDSVPADSLFGDRPGSTELRITWDEQKSNRPRMYRLGVREAMARTARLCGYTGGVLRPALGAKGKLLGILAVFRTEQPDFSPYEQNAISSFSHLTGIVLAHDRRRQSLLTRTEELKSIFQTYPDALVRISSEGRILESYSGNRLSEILRLQEIGSQQILWYLLPGKAALAVRNAVSRVASGSRMETVDFKLEHNRQQRYFEARLLALPAKNQQIAVLRDVTELKQTQLELKQVSERFRYLFDNSPDAIFVESLKGQVLDANQAACDLHQMTREELISRSFYGLIPEDEHEAAVARTMPLMAGEITNFESRSLCCDGTVVPVEVRSSPITYNGEPALLLHVRDISRQRQAEKRKREHERQLAHVSRLTMMGQLVAGIAHEIRQPLWSISTFADVCSELLLRPDAKERLPQLREMVGKLVSESQRVHAITTRMFDFARKGEPDREMTDLAGIIDEAIGLTAAGFRTAGIQTATAIDEDLPEIYCDRVLIEQTIVNLLNNACEAVQDSRVTGGRVVVTAAVDSTDPEFVTVTVSDNGPGLPEGVEPEQLFEGFFTTGRSGLGIGLALSRSFVEDHGGWIRAEQQPAGGMRFEFKLRKDGGTPADAD